MRITSIPFFSLITFPKRKSNIPWIQIEIHWKQSEIVYVVRCLIPSHQSNSFIAVRISPLSNTYIYNKYTFDIKLLCKFKGNARILCTQLHAFHECTMKLKGISRRMKQRREKMICQQYDKETIHLIREFI